MAWLGVLPCFIVIVIILYDAFETLLLPRRVARSIRFTRLFYRASWKYWTRLANNSGSQKRRFFVLSIFGPLSLPVLFSCWAGGLIVGFAGLHASLQTPMTNLNESQSLLDYLYFSGVTFFTLGFGDIAPTGTVGRALAVFEAGLGFGVLAVVIGYLPVMYQAFSKREGTISVLDARAGSPPTASEFLSRLGPLSEGDHLRAYFQTWEVWSAELLESHVSFPVLPFFRSQHDNQSWLAALAMILDTSALAIAGLPKCCPYQARLTFAMARHAVVDIAQIFRQTRRPSDHDRLPDEQLRLLCEHLGAAGVEVERPEVFSGALRELRELYEPFLDALSIYLQFSLPPFQPVDFPVDNWQTSAWMRRAGGFGDLAKVQPGDDHED